jgi:hypothetical protein
VSQCEGLVVIGCLEVLQRFQNLHSALTMASCISKKNDKKGIGFTMSTAERLLMCLLWIFSNDPWNLLHSAWDGAPSLGKG